MSDHIGPERHAELMELLSDANECPRLSEWEKDFIASIQRKLDAYGSGQS